MQRFNIRKLGLTTAVGLHMLVALTACAEAADVYVDGDSIGGQCSDARAASDVTASEPWCTPARAISGAPEGATVLLRAGTYSNIRALDILRTQMMTLKPAPGETVTLLASGATGPEEHAIYLKGSSNLRFKGFKIDGGAYFSDSSFVRLSDNEITGVGVTLRNVTDTLVQGNEFHTFSGQMRALMTSANVGEPGAVRLVIRGNEFRGIDHDAIALYWRLQDVTVEDNYIHDVHRPAGSSLHPDALQIAPQSEGAWGKMIVRRNRIVDFDQGLLVKDGTTRGLVLENNVIGGGGFFQAFVFDAPGVRITNNTIAGRLFLRAATTNANVTNNIIGLYAVEPSSSVAFSGHNLVDRAQYNPGYEPGVSDVDGRPKFRNASGFDYRLTPFSPGVDAGSADHGAPSVDVAKKPRPAGAGHDIGAYERRRRRVISGRQRGRRSLPSGRALSDDTSPGAGTTRGITGKLLGRGAVVDPFRIRRFLRE